MAEERRLPLRYVMGSAGEPITVRPYEFINGPPREHEAWPRRRPRRRRNEQGFAPWLEQQVDVAARRTLARDMHVDEAMIRRWINGGFPAYHGDCLCWTPIDSLPLSKIDKCLLGGDDSLWVLYPYLDEDPAIDEAYCFRCLATVMPLEVDGPCPWCGDHTIPIVKHRQEEAHAQG